MNFGALYADGAPRSEVETFVSRAGNVTHFHFDFMENFTLQLSGRKRWRLKRSAIGVPLRGCTPLGLVGRRSCVGRRAAGQAARGTRRAPAAIRARAARRLFPML